jgi:SAM-dependent methyltransferase
VDDKPPTYGCSPHYSGSEGIAYLKWQNSQGAVNGRINVRKFRNIEFYEKIVLDFGAGAGNLLEIINAKRKIAVEINAAAREILLEKGIECRSSIEEIDSSSVDVVISHHSLEHVPYPIQALREMLRVMKPGGELHLWLPIDDWRVQREYCANDVNHHLNTWTPQLIGNSLNEAGYDLNMVSIRVVNHAWIPGYKHLFRFPGFDFACKVWSILKKSRQLVVVAKKKN